MKPNDLYLTIAGAMNRMSRLGLPPLALADEPETLPSAVKLRGDKPIPRRKRRYHANASRRAERRWDGAQKMLKLLEPAGVRHDARALDALTRKYGI